MSQTLILTKSWLEQAGCLKEDGTINTDRLNTLMKGQRFMIDEITFLLPDNQMEEVFQLAKRVRKTSVQRA